LSIAGPVTGSHLVEAAEIRLLAFDAMAQRHERGELDPKAH